MARRRNQQTATSDDLTLAQIVDDMVVLNSRVVLSPSNAEDTDRWIESVLRSARGAAGKPGGTSLGAYLSEKNPAGLEAVKQGLREVNDLVSHGLGLVVFEVLAVDPPRVVGLLDGSEILMGVFQIEDRPETRIAAAVTWRRHSYGQLMGAELAEVDEFQLPGSELGFRKKLEELAKRRARNLVKPRHRALLVTNMHGVDDRELSAVATVCGVHLDIYRIMNPQDTELMLRLDELLRGSNYHLLLTFTDPTQTWIWKRIKTFKAHGGGHIALHVADAAQLPEALRAIEDTLGPPPSLGISSWGDVRETLPDIVHEGFVLTGAAITSCSSDNAYLYPARMLDHLKALSSAGEAWHEAEGNIGRRLEDWISEHFGIEIALHDGAGGAGKLVHDKVPLVAEPHVKVDDAKPLNECGRIYFALDTQNWRFVVHHVGVHL